MEENAAKVAELVAEISSASREQAQGVDQIISATEQMNQVTQQVAASEELCAQSLTLKDMVDELGRLVYGAKRDGIAPKRGNGNKPKADQNPVQCANR